MTATKSPFYQLLGGNIALARRRSRITQEKLGRIVGLSRTSITNIEKGRQPVQAHLLAEFARALGVEVGDLFPRPRVVAETKQPRMLDRLDPRKREWVQRVLAPSVREREK